MLWLCHHKTFENLKLQNFSPIVLIKILTIVLKEGRSERGYNPETPYNFFIIIISIKYDLSWMTHPPKL